MKHINRLLQAARKATKGQGTKIIAFIEYSPMIEAYTATGSIWNGVKGAGVERFYSEHSTAEEAESMREEGIDYIQGFYYSRPLPVQEFLEFLGKGKAS